MNISLAIFLMSFVGIGISQSLMFSFLSITLSDANIAEKDISLIASLGALSFVVSCIVLARKIHFKGPLFLLKIGIFTTAICELISGSVLWLSEMEYITPYQALYIFIINRVVLNGAWGGYFSAGLIYAGGVVRKENQARSIAAMGLSFAFGGMAGPFIASLVNGYGNAAPFIFSAIFSSFSFVCLMKCRDVQKGIKTVNESTNATFNKESFLHAAPHCVAAFGIIIALAVVQQTSAYFFRPYDSPTFTVSVSSLSFLSAGLIAGQLLVMTLGSKWSPLIYILNGAVIAAVSALFIVISSGGELLVSLAMILLTSLGAGIGIILPNLGVAILALCAEDEKPFASSSLNAAQGAGNIIGPFIGGMAFQQDRLMPFSIVIIVMLMVIFYSRYYQSNN